LESGRKNINEEVSCHWLRKSVLMMMMMMMVVVIVVMMIVVLGGNNYNNTCTQIYYILNAFNNSFPNTKLKSTRTQEI